MVLIPLAPALFPYTTLFRSDPDRRHPRRTATIGRSDIKNRSLWCPAATAQVPGHLRNQEPRFDEIAFEQPLRVGSEDRKSTRLNSSHVAISYAVFCLKKKND